MEIVINPGVLKGGVKVPPSKSMMQRACAGALLHHGTTNIFNPGYSEDDLAALRIIEQLGAAILSQSSDKVVVYSEGIKPKAGCIDCGESGLSTRMFTPIAALANRKIRIVGKGTLRNRPMRSFEEILPQLGIKLEGFNGYVPFEVEGPLTANDITIDGSESSQFLTGLLFALCYQVKHPVKVEVNNLRSKHYVDVTLQVLELFGYRIKNHDYKTFFIDPLRLSATKEIDIHIEGDWSSAAFWLVGAGLKGDVVVEGLCETSFQADKMIIDILRAAGANLRFESGKTFVVKDKLHAFETDLTDAPDLFPATAILAACCEGESSIKGLHRLKHKESDREKSIMNMLQAFGVKTGIQDDHLKIEGVKKLKGGRIDGNHDHRIVMAAAIGATIAEETTTITDAEAVAKSYPEFFSHLASLGIHSAFKKTV